MDQGDDSTADRVTTMIQYIERQAEPLYNYYITEPPDGMPASNEKMEAHDVIISSMRALAKMPQLDVEGFELVRFKTAVGDIYDPAERKAVYEPEVADFVKRHTGASEVRIFYPMLRGEEAQRRFPGSITNPAANVHVDETHESGPVTFDQVLGADAGRFRGRRFAIINLWRPITGPLRDHPLTCCDVQTVSEADLMSSHIISRVDEEGLPTPGGKVYETALYSVAHNPNHKWYYVPDMMPDEALLLKNYDSALDGAARFSPHTSFDNPMMGVDDLPRASIEVRCLTIW